MRTRLLAAALAAGLATLAWAGDVDSGKKVGDNLPAYHPRHVAGPDRGTDTCPV